MVKLNDNLRAARAALKSCGVNALLADANANPKLAKNIGMNVLTRPLHLAPAKLSGYEVCPMATKGCRAACLHTAGNPAYMRGKDRARVARTRAYFTAREAFMTCLVDEIGRHEKDAIKRDMLCGIRLNATSDIVWEAVPCTRNGVIYGRAPHCRRCRHPVADAADAA